LVDKAEQQQNNNGNSSAAFIINDDSTQVDGESRYEPSKAIAQKR
jgi:hypothetical protein